MKISRKKRNIIVFVLIFFLITIVGIYGINEFLEENQIKNQKIETPGNSEEEELESVDVSIMCPRDSVSEVNISNNVEEIWIEDCEEVLDLNDEQVKNLKIYTIESSSYDLEQINKMGNLEDLTFFDDHLEKIPHLSNLNLKSLQISDSSVNKIENLEELGSLEELHLEFTNINTIENVEGLNSLKELYVPPATEYISGKSKEYIQENNIKVYIPNAQAKRNDELDINELEVV